MATSHNHLEQLIAEAFAADKAGVFRATPVNSRQMLAAPASSLTARVYEACLVGLPLAACLAIVVGVTALNTGPTVLVNGSVATNGPATHVPGDASANGEFCTYEMLTQCVSGPGNSISASCGAADLDRDGDVDLGDLSQFQRLAAAVQS